MQRRKLGKFEVPQDIGSSDSSVQSLRPSQYQSIGMQSPVIWHWYSVSCRHCPGNDVAKSTILADTLKLTKARDLYNTVVLNVRFMQPLEVYF